MENRLFLFEDKHLYRFDHCGQERFALASKKDKSVFSKPLVDNWSVMPELSPELCFDRGGPKR